MFKIKDNEKKLAEAEQTLNDMTVYVEHLTSFEYLAFYLICYLDFRSSLAPAIILNSITVHKSFTLALIEQNNLYRVVSQVLKTKLFLTHKELGNYINVVYVHDSSEDGE